MQISPLSHQGNSFGSVYRFERHILFPKLLAQNCPDYELSNCMYNADGEKEGTLRRFLCNEIGEATNVYSIEASMYGFATDDKENPVRPYTEEDCETTFWINQAIEVLVDQFALYRSDARAAHLPLLLGILQGDAHHPRGALGLRPLRHRRNALRSDGGGQGVFILANKVNCTCS